MICPWLHALEEDSDVSTFLCHLHHGLGMPLFFCCVSRTSKNAVRIKCCVRSRGLCLSLSLIHEHRIGGCCSCSGSLSTISWHLSIYQCSCSALMVLAFTDVPSAIFQVGCLRRAGLRPHWRLGKTLRHSFRSTAGTQRYTEKLYFLVELPARM